MKPEEKKERSDHAVVTFGRANPPHAGHIKLFREVKKHAESVGADHHVFLSQTNDPSKNPLTHAQKVGFINKMAPDINVHKGSEVKDPVGMMHHLYKQGYKKVTVVAGSDRAKHYQNLLNQYNGKEGGYKFDKIHVKSISRDPDSEGVAGASATKMREFAKTGNFKEFRKHYPKDIAKDVFMATKKGLKESTALFLLGGPGSGKDIVLRETALGTDVMEIGLARLHDACVNQKDIVEVDGRPLVVNGNADDADKVLLTKKVLEAVGYKTAMVFVAVSDSQSKYLNESRTRPVKESIRANKHAQSMRNLQLFKEQFASWNIFHNNSDQPDLSETEKFVALFFTGNLLDEQAKAFIAEDEKADIQKHIEMHKKIDDLAAQALDDSEDEDEANEEVNEGRGQHFMHGGGGVMTCFSCGRPTRQTGQQGGNDICPDCHTLHSYENQALDGEELHKSEISQVRRAARHLKKKGEHFYKKAHGFVPHLHKYLKEEELVETPNEFNAHRALQDAAKERQKKQAHVAAAGSSYFDHVHDSQVGKHSQLAKKDKSPQVRSVPQPKLGSSTQGLHREGFSTWKKNQVKRDKGPAPGSKGAAAPATKFDSRTTDGMAMTATLAADSVQAPKGKTLKELRQVPKSPEALTEPQRVYEDWGAEIKTVAGVKINAPFKTNEGYSVIVEGEGELKTIDFQKNTGTSQDWENNNV